MKLTGLIFLTNAIINILCIIVNIYCDVNYIKNIAIYVIQTYKVIGGNSVEITIKAKPKEMADFILGLQNQPNKTIESIAKSFDDAKISRI